MNSNFVEDRRKGVGGTDVAAILGICPYRTPLDIYLEKIGASPAFEGNIKTVIGIALEDVVLKRYQADTGNKVRKSRKAIVNKKYPWLRANVDGLVVGKSIVFEAKTSLDILNYGKSRVWGDNKTDVPDSFLLQVHHYMIATGRKQADIMCMFGFNDFKLFNVRYNKLVADKIIDSTNDFWHKNVLKQVAPDPINKHDVEILYTDSDRKDYVADEYVCELITSIKQKRKEQSDAKSLEKSLRDKIAIKLKDHTHIVDDRNMVIASYKTASNGNRILRIN